MKSAVIVCLAFCLIGLVFCQTQQGAASTGSSSNALQRAQLMQALGSRGLGRGLGRLAPYLFLSGGRYQLFDRFFLFCDKSLSGSLTLSVHGRNYGRLRLRSKYIRCAV